MKKRRLYQFFALAFAMAFVGCGQDELTNGNSGMGDENSKDAVYMNVTVQLPAVGGSTRGATTTPDDGDYVTSGDGTEEGQEYENTVSEVMLVLTDRKNRLIAYGTHQSATQSGDVVSSVQKISKSDLLTYYGSDNKLTSKTEGDETLNEWEIYVYVFCNPTGDLKTKMAGAAKNSANWIDAVCSITDDTSKENVVWKNGSFLMSSAVLKDCKKELPVNFDDWKDYTTESNAFNLSGINKPGQSSEVDNTGDIRVERSIARFDFRDGSQLGGNTYDVLVEKDAGDNDIVTMQIQLTKMALVNMSKNFYYLRRVSDDGKIADATNSNHFEICGTEYKTNYVVDTDAEQKSQSKVTADYPFSTYFSYPLGTVSDGTWEIKESTRNQWDTYDIADVLKGGNDNDDDWNPDGSKGDYKIWRYVTENTIPGIAEQKHGVSTGIVFKGKMVKTDKTSASLAEALDGVTGDSSSDAILYSIYNNLYVTWREVRAAAIAAGPGKELYIAAFGKKITVTPEVGDKEHEYEGAVYSDDPDSPDALWAKWQKDIDVADNLSAFKKAATGAKFTLYQSSVETSSDGKTETPGYYCYYYYWNRHNNNGNPGQMGTMEFAVVRNNVYKLAVTEINRLGHPRLSENDPDPEDPDKPDESDDVYLKLSVKVLPWVVRINNIEF